jgi:hypothetical protein
MVLTDTQNTDWRRGKAATTRLCQLLCRDSNGRVGRLGRGSTGIAGDRTRTALNAERAEWGAERSEKQAGCETQQLEDISRNRGKSVGAQVPHARSVGRGMAGVRHRCEGRRRNETKFNMTRPGFCPYYYFSAHSAPALRPLCARSARSGSKKPSPQQTLSDGFNPLVADSPSIFGVLSLVRLSKDVDADHSFRLDVAAPPKRRR